MNIIERLKNNEDHIIFADMTPEEQECLKKIPKRYIETLTDKMGALAWVAQWGDILSVHLAYRIKADYQPQPEYVDLEVKEYKDGNVPWLGAILDPEAQDILPYPFTHLNCLPALPAFRCFWVDHGMGYGDSARFYEIGMVATRIAAGWNINVRFERLCKTNES